MKSACSLIRGLTTGGMFSSDAPRHDVAIVRYNLQVWRYSQANWCVSVLIRATSGVDQWHRLGEGFAALSGNASEAVAEGENNSCLLARHPRWGFHSSRTLFELIGNRNQDIHERLDHQGGKAFQRKITVLGILYPDAAHTRFAIANHAEDHRSRSIVCNHILSDDHPIRIAQYHPTFALMRATQPGVHLGEHGFGDRAYELCGSLLAIFFATKSAVLSQRQPFDVHADDVAKDADIAASAIENQYQIDGHMTIEGHTEFQRNGGKRNCDGARPLALIAGLLRVFKAGNERTIAREIHV